MDKQKKKKISLRSVLMIILLAIFIISATVLVIKYLDERENKKGSDEALLIAGLSAEGNSRVDALTREISGWETSEAEPAETAADESEIALPEELQYLAEIDLDALREVNEDVAGWLIIPDTVISYPLMREAAKGEDNTFYLKHTWQGASNSAGAIFLDYRCSSDLTDFNTVIYGHRMRNDTMFGSLKYYSDAEYLSEHPRVYIVTDKTIRCYDIFAVWQAPVNGIVYSFDFTTDELKNELINTAITNSAVSTGIVPTAEDRILTLSTCTGLGYSARLIVQSVLEYEINF